MSASGVKDIRVHAWSQSQKQLMRYGRESGPSSGERRLQTPPKSLDLLGEKRVLEILAMVNVNFPPPPPMVGTPEKQNMNKFCDYYQDRGHNTNDCYHLKKQIEEIVASGRLAHLVKDIRQGGRRARAQPKEKKRLSTWVRRIHVDGGSSSEVMYENCFRNLSYRTRSRLKESRIPLVGFSGEVSYPLGVINLEVTMGECRKTRTVIMVFVVVKSPSPYNALLVNPRVTLALVETRSRRPGKEPMQSDDMEERRQIDKGKKPPKFSVEKTIVVNDNYPDQLVTIGGAMSTECRHALIHTLRKNVDIFAWTPIDMTGIPKAITEHSLATYPHIKPNVYKKRSLAPNRRKVVTDEVNEWLKADLDKACPKDLYPLPEIDWKIESLMGFQYKCFLDAYKGLVDSAFKEQIRINLEAYVDDMVIKSRTEQNIIKDIEQTFSTLRRINMKLNPKKYSFGMEDGKFLGCVVTSEGIRANPEKTKAVMDMPSPRTLKQMQSLNGKLAALKRFLSKWTKAAEAAFLKMKKLVFELPTLTTPKKGRLAKWDVELWAYGITYVPRVAVKGQVLADFLVDTSIEINVTPEVAITPRVEDIPESSKARENLTPAPDDVEYSYILRLNFSNSNNDAKYEAILAGLRIATKIQVKNIHAFVDSKLVASQVEGSYEAKGEEMIKYQEKVLELAGAFNRFRITHIPRAENRKADDLSKLATVQFDYLSKEVLVGVLNERSVEAQEVNMVVEENGTSPEGSRKGEVSNRGNRLLYQIDGGEAVNYHYWKWAEKLKIQLISTLFYHPQGNGAVERANRSLLRGIRTKLEKRGSAWAEEVPNVLWAHRIMKKTSNGETPFSLTYGIEAVIFVEIGMPTHRTSNVNEKTNDQKLCLNLDLLEERREIAAIKEARKNEVSRAANTGKLGPTWEGPYKVIQAFQSGAYKLSNMEGEEIPRTRHACNLRRCYRTTKLPRVNLPLHNTCILLEHPPGTSDTPLAHWQSLSISLAVDAWNRSKGSYERIWNQGLGLKEEGRSSGLEPSHLHYK
uniref:Integrase catalytic domain-containing protein n=1 Tax=Tanacetum cinerariifolium TaxID=118510 RepID=A0A699HL32_TANCI|nr:hypothetical protein [Tanacetum cinerariifolium]